MNDVDDPLWDPAVPADAELRRWQALLAPYSFAARGLGERPLATLATVRPRRRRWIAALAACLVAAIGLTAGYAYRLAWSEGRPWPVHAAAGGSIQTTQVAPGEWLDTGAQESLTVAVARVGRVELSSQSSMRLIETRSGHHRIELDRGHLRARIWAPPGYFTVDAGSAEVVDLGCDFDVWKRADGPGRVAVRSGWIVFRLGAREVLLPAGFAMDFDAQRASTPLRTGAAPAFARAVTALDHALDGDDAPAERVAALSVEVAATAADADALTLLSLLTRQPTLARGALYPRLARALGVSGRDVAHRAAWARGEQTAIDAWWRRMPTQPKHWWSNWADALP